MGYKRRLAGFLAVFFLPYVVTLAWSGGFAGVYGNGIKRDLFESGKRAGDSRFNNLAGNEVEGEMVDGGSDGKKKKKIYIGDGRKGYLDVETYLIGVVARQIPAEYELEAIKAQAVIARTYLYGQMEGKTEIKEEELGLTYLEEEQMESLWGRQKFVEYYDKICQAVRETEGMVMALDEGEEVDKKSLVSEPLFHRASAGYTREGDQANPYLASVDSHWDVEAEGYLTVREWEPKEVVRLMTEAALKNGAGEVELTEKQVTDTLQLVGRDKVGYVKEIQIGAHIYTGDEIQMALGLPSTAFTLEEHEGKLRAICKGIGHGYGLSQYGANGMAKEGKSAEEILTYYYQNIIIISLKS